MSTTEALRNLIVEAEAANQLALREFGAGIIDKRVIRAVRDILEAEATPVVDLKHTAYDQLQQAASASKWIPPEYYANDWIADCCRWLREGPTVDIFPIDMVLHCPACGLQHIDAPDPMGETEGFIGAWTNPPHLSHLCHGCGHIWRPADVPTNGVQSVKTKGKDDSEIVTVSAEDVAACAKIAKDMEAESPKRWEERPDGSVNEVDPVDKAQARAPNHVLDQFELIACRQTSTENDVALTIVRKYLRGSAPKEP